VLNSQRLAWHLLKREYPNLEPRNPFYLNHDEYTLIYNLLIEAENGVLFYKQFLSDVKSKYSGLMIRRGFICSGYFGYRGCYEYTFECCNGKYFIIYTVFMMQSMTVFSPIGSECFGESVKNIDIGDGRKYCPLHFPPGSVDYLVYVEVNSALKLRRVNWNVTSKSSSIYKPTYRYTVDELSSRRCTSLEECGSIFHCIAVRYRSSRRI